MRLDFLRDETSRWRKVSALGIIAAFLFAFALSDAPRLHEHLHKALGADHECVVTILLSGMYDHSACVPPSTIPPLDPSTSVVGPQQFPSIEAGLEFSLLEHAPPLFA
jgi:hypothetical protein